MADLGELMDIVRRRIQPGVVVDVATALTIAGCGATVVSVAAGWAISPRQVAAQGLLPVIGGAAVIAAAGAAFRRRRAMLAIGSAVALWAAGMIAPAAIAQSRPAWSQSARELTVYSANMRRDNTTPALALAKAEQSDADVVVIVEYARAFEPALRASGLLEKYPTVVRDEDDDRNLLLTQLPVKGTGVVHEAGFELPSATVVVGSTPVFIAGVHTQSPTHFAYMDRWQEQVSGVARALDGHDNAIAIGDFNTSVWNPPMRRLLDWGFTDAADATGNGLDRTWGPAPTGTDVQVPILGIDHAISRGADLVPLSIHEGDIPGSDHRSIEVTYAVR